MKVHANNRFWVWHLLLPLLLFGSLTLLFAWKNWDLTISNIFYDPASGIWPFKRSWWAEGLIHQGGKRLILFIALGSLLLSVSGWVRPALRSWRRAFLFLALCIALGTGIVGLGKNITNRHCPWDLDIFGGSVPHTGLFEARPQACKRGHCFPAGHASGGFSLMGSYFIFYPKRRKLALAGLATGLALGTIFSFGQVARGAHFVSHNFWSAMICWLAAVVLFKLVFKGNLLDAVQVGPLEQSKSTERI